MEKLPEENVPLEEVREERQAEEDKNKLAELFVKLEQFENDSKALYLKTKAALALNMTDPTDYAAINKEIGKFLESKEK